ncbi:MAG TPA: glycerol-3-phosphate acyltransferase [Anaerolineaceae bacterium]|nr:glycerol-3-phosphate acyltransferase [Anaerolineaceae bacterium]HPN50109.1 glycerol-3-phosphate acyltransferase [Anaerolineaceae bacterium]
MELIVIILVLVVSYLLGAIPFGVIFVRLIGHKDILKVESGRTGGTNALRAAGFGAGFLTALMDMLKGTAAVLLARWLLPGTFWLEALAGMASILGHNYSIFLMERNENGRMVLRGGAGGATCAGVSLGLWPASFLIIFPLSASLWYFLGYASVATMSIAFFSIVIFTVRALMGLSPWEYAIGSLGAELLLVWALRPNIKRLIQGNERLVGWRVRNQKKKA